MRKIIFVLAAVLAIFSGVAAVSATEGHLVDIKAHVENAIGVETYDLNFGTVYPEQVFNKTLVFGLTDSYLADTGVNRLDYFLYWELKPIEDGFMDADGDDYFEPMNAFLEVTDGDADLEWWGYDQHVVPTPTDPVLFCDGQLFRTEDVCDAIDIKFTVPVFDNYYNPLTDPIVDPEPKQLVLADEDYYEEIEEHCGKDMVVPKADLGINLKIQVWRIWTTEGEIMPPIVSYGDAIR